MKDNVPCVPPGTRNPTLASTLAMKDNVPCVPPGTRNQTDPEKDTGHGPQNEHVHIRCYQ